jgi:arylsulfatase A-like enzyme
MAEMKRVRLITIVCVVFAIFGGISAQSENAPPGIERVLLLSLDGARPDALLQVEAPNIMALAARGASAWTAQTILPPATLPAHASMLTGLDVSEHGMSHNDSLYPCPAIEAPTFLTMAVEAGFRAAMVVGKEKFCQYIQTDAMDYTFARLGDRSVADRVIELLADDYEVIFAHFPNPDYFGHLNGWMSDVYLYQLLSTDEQIGRVLDALDEHNLTDKTLIILTADHGGHGFSHGQDIPENRSIPWLIAGPGIEPGGALENVSVADTAQTILWALGLPQPESTLGRPVIEAFAIFGQTNDMVDSNSGSS